MKKSKQTETEQLSWWTRIHSIVVRMEPWSILLAGHRTIYDRRAVLD